MLHQLSGTLPFDCDFIDLRAFKPTSFHTAERNADCLVFEKLNETIYVNAIVSPIKSAIYVSAIVSPIKSLSNVDAMEVEMQVPLQTD